MARLSMCRKRASMAICAPRRPILLFFIVLVFFLTSQIVLCKRNHLRVITDSNWEEVMEGEWMIEFFAPWCPACTQLQPVWAEFAEWGEDMGISIAKVDVTEQPGLSGRFIITSLPTIYHCKDGMFRKYEGARTKDDFLDFIDQKKWQDIEPISTWLGPSSFLMSGMSAVFKLSVFIRQCHNYFTEQLGIPVLVSYAIFVLAMLFTGLTLGLMLVFIADCVFPSRQFPPPHSYYQKKRTLEQARLTTKPENKQEGEGEDREQKNIQGWRCPPEGEQESRGEGPSEETLRRRVLGTGEEEEDT